MEGKQERNTGLEVVEGKALHPMIGEILEKHRGERHIIVLQDYPDPDAISSAFAHQLMSARFNIETAIVYGSRISHHQNVALVRLLGIELQRYEETLDLKAYAGAVFVDNQGTTAGEIVESFSISGIGYLRAEDRDAIPQAADFLLTEENIHTAIVYGIITGEEWNETLVGSMRTSKITIDPDAFIKEVFGKDAAGHYFGGGKLSAGGFQIPIGFLSGGNDEGYREQKWDVYDVQIKQKIFAKIGVEEKPGG